MIECMFSISCLLCIFQIQLVLECPLDLRIVLRLIIRISIVSFFFQSRRLRFTVQLRQIFISNLFARNA